jgi:hypothetical protein
MHATTVGIDAISAEIGRTRAVQAAPFFVVAGVVGASGLQLLRTARASFPAVYMPAIDRWSTQVRTYTARQLSRFSRCIDASS